MTEAVHARNNAMITTVMMKELRAILLSPKFLGSFVLSTLLILLSVYLGIVDYHRAVDDYTEAGNLTAQELQQRTNYSGTSVRINRLPDPMQIVVSGVNNDIGRRSAISKHDPVKLEGSFFSEETLFALFRYFDLAFIIQAVLSLFALLFTYDAVNGERESGTLQLTFSNTLRRGEFIAGKFLGAAAGLLVPLAIPLLIGILLILTMGVPFSASDWLRFAGFTGISMLYILMFTALGILTSVIARRSSTSFLVALVAWVLIVFIVPRTAAMAASGIVHVPSAAELDSQRDTYEKNRWQAEIRDMERRLQERRRPMEKMTDAEKKAYQDAHEWEWMTTDDSLRRIVTEEINAYGIKVNEDFRNRKAQLEHLTYNLSRVSPAAAFQIAVMELAQTGISVKARYEDAMNAFRTMFTEYLDRKQKQSGGMDGIRIQFDSNTGFRISTPRADAKLDFSDAPVFRPPAPDLPRLFSSAIIDTGIVACSVLLCFGLALFRFLRCELN